MAAGHPEEGKQMRTHLLRVVALATAVALTAAGIATAAKPTVVRAGNLILTVDGGVAPKRLPKKRMAPIKLRISANVRTANGAHPPAARKTVIDFDKHGTINARGLPKCGLGRLEARTTSDAKAACRKAIVGTGKTKVRVAFAEQAPFSATGPLVVFNGGTRGKITKMYIHAYVNVPTPTALVTVVKVKRVHKGRYGTRASARIPTIAGGAGSLIRFNLGIKRKFKHRGRQRSYLSARCANGRFFAFGKVFFAGGTRLAGRVVRPCRQRG
jgi:hypothetical protein